MVATYDRQGISFLYPQNWQVTEDGSPTGDRCVTLQSPDSGFWMLQVFDTSRSPTRLAAEALRSIKQEYGEVEVTQLDEWMEGTPLTGYDIQFFYLDFVIRCQIRSFPLGTHHCVILCQAEDGEFDELEQVFTAITTSLLK